MPHNYRSVLAGGSTTTSEFVEPLQAAWSAMPQKLYWFLAHGYKPHVYQQLFHTAQQDGKVVRFRHLVAGRRGGKTLSAAWEVVYYCLHPEQFHMDAFGAESKRPLWVWALAKDHKLGRPSLLTTLEVLDQVGLVKDRDYRYNKSEKIIEFEQSGTLLEFKSADDPQSLRGAGLDILWIDEAAFVPNDEAWNVVRPSLSSPGRAGWLISTTTPAGKNWFHDEFWSDLALADANQFRVEYTSIDNPFFARPEWEYARRHSHPVQFKQEYMASFDAMAGIALHGEWLKFFILGQGTPQGSPEDVRLIPKDGQLPLRKFIGVDPAVSQSDKADYFAMCLIGIEDDNSRAYVLDTFKGRLEFPDQIDKITEWWHRYSPQMIGVEAVAFQAALVQQLERLPGLPPIVPVFSRGKKKDRILSMSPLFKIGRIRIHRQHHDFIDEWVSYNPDDKNPKDDLLDATEIALSLAGVLLPYVADNSQDPDGYASIEDEARAQILSIQSKDGSPPIDEHLGGDY